MARFIRRNDLWALAAFALWFILLLSGLFPNWTFLGLRAAAGVLPHQAVVNNPLAISISLAIYIAIFVSQRCLEENTSHKQAKAHGLQVGLLGIIAFAPIEPEVFIQIWLMPDAALQADAFGKIGSIAAVKICAWIYLLSLFTRYYLGHNYHVFANMTTLIPSARKKQAPPHDAAESAHPSMKK